MDKYAVGLAGELKACEYLRNKNYVILDRNVVFKNKGELDIVARDGNCLVFVEVRTRSDNFFGDPLETVTKSKIKRIVTASRLYLAERNNNYRYDGYRYDVIGILRDNIEHIENAFYAKW